jgi:hypothetical protein
VSLSVKAFLHIHLFSVSIGRGESLPVGIESIVQLFEPWLLTSLDLDHFTNEQQYIGTKAAKYPNVDIARTAALNNIPGGFTTAQKGAMIADLQNAKTLQEVLGVYLKYTGRRRFEGTFP